MERGTSARALHPAHMLWALLPLATALLRPPYARFLSAIIALGCVGLCAYNVFRKQTATEFRIFYIVLGVLCVAFAVAVFLTAGGHGVLGSFVSVS